MGEKLHIFIAFMLVLINALTACSREDVKYISSEAGGLEAGVTEVVSDVDQTTQDYTEYSDCVATGTDYGLYESGKENLVPVYVCGAVLEPGVYYVSPDALKEEALQVAGGFDLYAATDYINLAETVVAGEKIYFPYTYELEEGYNMSLDEAGQGTSRKVNINKATKEELMTLPGIGESKAEAIIKYRDNNGLFQDIQDVTKIPGIKEGVYNNIKDHIVVN